MNTANFLQAVSNEARAMILGNISEHYGITPLQAYDEVVDGEAEHLLDYVTGSARAATSALMQKHGFR